MFQRIAKPFRISIHALLAESDASTRIDTDNNSDFYPRSPCGERHQECSGSQHPPDFYPRSPCGERLFEYIQAGTGILFLSTLSLRRATSTRIASNFKDTFLSTLSLRRATESRQPCARPTTISIHALLAESDVWLELFLYYQDNNFYPRSPCGERQPHCYKQSAYCFYFYPRSPCGERPAALPPGLAVCAFLSTLSLRRATPPAVAAVGVTRWISIHALLAESDSKSAQNSGALLRIWNKFYGDFIFMLTGKAVFYPFCPCFFHIFWCEGTGNFMIAFPSH